MKYKNEVLAINRLVKKAVKALNPKLPDLSQYSEKAQNFGKNLFAQYMHLYDNKEQQKRVAKKRADDAISHGCNEPDWSDLPEAQDFARQYWQEKQHDIPLEEQHKRLARARAGNAISQGLNKPDWSDLLPAAQDFAHQYWQEKQHDMLPDEQQKRLAKKRANDAISHGRNEPDWSDLPAVQDFAHQYWQEKQRGISLEEQQKRLAKTRADNAISQGRNEPDWSNFPSVIQNFAHNYFALKLEGHLKKIKHGTFFLSHQDCPGLLAPVTPMTLAKPETLETFSFRKKKGAELEISGTAKRLK